MKPFFLLTAYSLFWFSICSSQQDLESSLRLGYYYEQTGRHEDALKLYESLFSRFPENQYIFESLIRIYSQLKRYDNMIHLLKEEENKNHSWSQPERILPLLSFAYLAQGRLDDGKKTIKKYISLNPKNPSSYYTSASIYLQNKRNQEAIETYILGRKNIGGNFPFAMELSVLYEMEKDYKNAIIERLHFSESTNTDQESEILRISEKMEYREFVSLLKSKNFSQKTRKILGDFYIKRKEYENALSCYRDIKTLNDGNFLLNFANTCESNFAFDAAYKAYKLYLSQFPNTNEFLMATLGIGRCLEFQKKFTEAQTVYESIYIKNPNSRESEEALFRTANINLEHLNNPKKAREYYLILSKQSNNPIYVKEVPYKEILCIIREGNLQKASKEAERILSTERDSVILHKIYYLYARIQFYKQNFDSSIILYRKLATEFPNGDFANDALNEILFLDEMQEHDETSLRNLSSVIFLSEQRKDEEALSTLRNIQKTSLLPVIRSRCFLEIGNIYERQQKIPQAQEAYKSIVTTDSKSFLAPLALVKIGNLLANNGREKEARKSYEEVILNYPQSLLAEFSRLKIKELDKE